MVFKISVMRVKPAIGIFSFSSSSVGPILITLLAGLIVGYIAGTWRPPHTSSEVSTPTVNVNADPYVTEWVTRPVRNSSSDSRILCWVMTGPTTHMTKAMAVNKTWGQRCDVLLFMSSVYDSRLPTVALPVEDGRDYLWIKTREAFRYIYERGYLDSVGWVVKADDDTYIVVENLRQYVGEMDPAQALLLGLRIKGYSSKGFMSGGAGYVLSREAVRVFVTQALNNVRCNTDELQYEDVAMGICLEDAGVNFVDTRDAYGKQRFYGSSPYVFVSNDHTLKWMRYMMVDEYPQGPKFGSRSAISFHYISPTDMYVMDYLLYGLDVSKA